MAVHAPPLQVAKGQSGSFPNSKPDFVRGVLLLRYESHGIFLRSVCSARVPGMKACAGDWLALKYDCKELKDRLSRQFQALR